MRCGVGLIVLRRLWVPGAPGDAVVLTSAEPAGVWKDERGGSLVLAGDGTFSASSVCGDRQDRGPGALPEEGDRSMSDGGPDGSLRRSQGP